MVNFYPKWKSKENFCGEFLSKVRSSEFLRWIFIQILSKLVNFYPDWGQGNFEENFYRKWGQEIFFEVIFYSEWDLEIFFLGIFVQRDVKRNFLCWIFIQKEVHRTFCGEFLPKVRSSEILWWNSTESEVKKHFVTYFDTICFQFLEMR